jgi:hypothetical protein
LEHIGDARKMQYSVDKRSEYAYPPLGITLFWCKRTCEELLTDLDKKQADEKDSVSIKREIEFLNGVQADWKANHKSGQIIWLWEKTRFAG